MLWKNEEDRLSGKNVTKQQDNPEFHPIKRGANDKTVFQETDLNWKKWFFRNLVEAQVAEDHFSFEQVKRCSPKHYSLYSF